MNCVTVWIDSVKCPNATPTRMTAMLIPAIRPTSPRPVSSFPTGTIIQRGPSALSKRAS